MFGSVVEYRASGAEWSITIDGDSELSEETRQRMRLYREDGMFWPNYFGFLAGLPMKLTDPGTNLAPEIIETKFMGRDVLAVRATYDEAVGSDIWYYYFEPRTAELIGCRFFRDETESDGEYLTFEGLTEGALRIPKRRQWFMNTDDRYLGTDSIIVKTK